MAADRAAVDSIVVAYINSAHLLAVNYADSLSEEDCLHYMEQEVKVECFDYSGLKNLDIGYFDLVEMADCFHHFVFVFVYCIFEITYRLEQWLY